MSGVRDDAQQKFGDGAGDHFFDKEGSGLHRLRRRADLLGVCQVQLYRAGFGFMGNPFTLQDHRKTDLLGASDHICKGDACTAFRDIQAVCRKGPFGIAFGGRGGGCEARGR